MRKKDLPQLQISSIIPQAVRHYIAANEEEYGNKPYVHKKLYPKFMVLEDDFRELGISSKDYAYVIVKLLRPIIVKKRLKCIPVNMYISDYALQRYKEFTSKEVASEIIDSTEAELEHCELLVARMLIERNISSDKFVRLSSIVEEMKPLLSDDWLKLYEDRRSRPDVTDILMKEYRIRHANNYMDIIYELRKNN